MRGLRRQAGAAAAGVTGTLPAHVSLAWMVNLAIAAHAQLLMRFAEHLEMLV